MTSPLRLRLAPLALLVPAAAPAAAHEDDPKILDRQPAYVGPGFRAADAARAPQTFASSVGAAAAYPASGVTLLSWLPLGEFGTQDSGNDCWGYVSPSGREYAIIGLSEGTGFVEVTDPSDAQVVAMHPGPSSLWRDVKVYGDHAYAVSEGGSGIQVFDLSQIDSGVVTFVQNELFGGDTTATHNVAIDTESGFLYRCGGGSNGLRIYDLSDPDDPAFVGSWSTKYVHDVQVVTYVSGPFAGKQVAFACTGFNGGFTSPGLDVLDVTDKQNVQVVDTLFYPGAQYSHQCWLSEDGSLLYLNDELDEDGVQPTTTHVVDVSSPTSTQYLGSFTNGNGAVGHNLYTSGGRLYEANYRSGLRVFDLADPVQPTEIAWFDTYPEDDAASFNGLWSTYPYFPSGIVIGSDMEKGLFVWWIGPPQLTFGYPNGLPTVLDPAGETFLVHVGEEAPGTLQPGTAQMHFDDGSGVQSVALVDLGGGDFEASFPPLACGTDVSFWFTAESTDGVTWVDPLGSGADVHAAAVADVETVVFAFDMEANAGWVSGAPGDDASTGDWTRGDPIGTAAQPELDRSPGGSDCWFTGQGSPGGALGENDVDGGSTTLVSPALDLAGVADPIVRYWRWYNNETGATPGTDVFRVDVSDDGGGSWTGVEVVGPAGEGAKGGWILHSFRLRDFASPTPSVRVRFVASDLGDGSIVEAAIDDFEVLDLGCPDCNGNGLSDALDVADGTSLDLDGEGTPDECQPLSASTGTLSLQAGGTQVLSLDAGPSFGGDLHLLLGTTSGTAPGLPLGGLLLPLNVDGYFDFTLASPNVPPLQQSLGFLDAQGAASASFAVPPGADPALAGALFHHAYLVLDQSSFALTFASNAMPLELLP